MGLNRVGNERCSSICCTTVCIHYFFSMQMRKGMIDQNQGQTYLKVKQHFDFMVSTLAFLVMFSVKEINIQLPKYHVTLDAAQSTR